MRSKTYAGILVVGAGLLLSVPAMARDWPKDQSFKDYFGGWGGLNIPVANKEKVFLPAEKRANFTFFHGVTNLAVQDGKLTFVTVADKVTLGWGNYMGNQALPDIVDLWEGNNVPVLRVKQSGELSQWHATFAIDGKLKFSFRPPQVCTPAKLEGTQWQEIQLPSATLTTIPTPDGLEIVIQAPKGTRFEIEWLKMVQPRAEGYMRKEFVLPSGKIWKAVADVGSFNRRWFFGVNRIDSVLYVNGQEVPRNWIGGLYATAPVDLSPYLRSGTNCLGFYGYRLHPSASSFNYIQGAIIMESGAIVTVRTDNTWSYAPEKTERWNQPGFNDGSWTNIRAGMMLAEVMQNMPPTYPGYLEIRNPYKSDLYYTDTREVLVNVLVPRGLADRQPVVEYRLCRVDANGADAAEVVTGQQTFYEAQDISLFYRLNLGRCDRGVYTLALRLLDSDGKIIEEREREPLVVLRQKPLREIEGTNYKEGLDLELEDTIDFTNPKDPHPWMEAVSAGASRPTTGVDNPLIVEKGGLMYRETTGKTRSSFFSYRLGEFKHPGDFYLLELEYPDDADRIVEVMLSTKKPKVWSNSQSGVGAETGGKFHKTGKMQTLSWIHVADPGIHSVDIINSVNNWPAAAKLLKIYHIRGDLPAVKGGASRRYGIYTESCHRDGGFGMNFGVGQPRSQADVDKDLKELSLMQRYIKDLAWMEQSCDRYMQYLKFAGQNIHFMGCFQYDDNADPVIPRDRDNSSRITRCFKTMLANVLNANDIDIMADIQFSMSANALTVANNAQVARGADTMWMINQKGEQFYVLPAGNLACNYLHPNYTNRLNEVLTQITDTFGGLPHFKGICFAGGLNQLDYYYIPAFGWQQEWDNPLAFSYDDITFAAFAKDTGTDLGIDPKDPKRFELRATLVKNEPLRQKFLAWRCRRLVAFYADAATTLRQKRPDLDWITSYGPEEEKFFKYLIASGKSFDGLMKEFAVDIGALGAIPRFSVLHWVVSWRDFGSGGYSAQSPYMWIPRESPDVYGVFEKLPLRTALCRTSWDENFQATAGYAYGNNLGNPLKDCDWMLDAQRTRALPQPSGYNIREALIQEIINLDPEYALNGFCDLNTNVGGEQELREVMRLFTQLPAERFERMLDTGLESNLAIRRWQGQKESWFYVANPGYWHIAGMLTIKTGGAVTDVATGRQVSPGGACQLNLKLAPFGLTVYRVASPQLDITAYVTETMASEELAHMTGIIGRVREIMGNPEIVLVLAPEDKTFMEDTLRQVDQALKDKQYARAWSLVKNYRFWSYWKDYLEKAAAGLARLPASLTQEPPPADPMTIRSLTVAKADSQIKLDGELSEAVWGKTKYSGAFRNQDQMPTLNETAIKAAYDDQALYIAIACADRNVKAVKATAKGEDGFFSSGDDILAVFIQPDETQPIYYQMGVNTQGAQFDQKVTAGKRDYKFHPDWQAVTRMENGYWITEVRFPFAGFGLPGKGNASWRLDVFRLARDNMLEPCEWSLTRGSWHEPKYFGKLTFN